MPSKCQPVNFYQSTQHNIPEDLNFQMLQVFNLLQDNITITTESSTLIHLNYSAIYEGVLVSP